MEINITPKTRKIWQNTLGQLSGPDRRLFMASVVKGMGRGGVAWAKRELEWDRTTIRKGMHELESGIVCLDNVGMRGRKGFAAKLPRLQDDLRTIGEASSQTDPTFRATQLYRRLTAAEAKCQLLEMGYSEKELPSERSLCRMLGELGFKPRRVAKSKPLRKVRQTDAIFETVHRINAEADADPGTIRLSIDTKTTVPIGNLSRGGKSRRGQKSGTNWCGQIGARYFEAERGQTNWCGQTGARYFNLLALAPGGSTVTAESDGNALTVTSQGTWFRADANAHGV